MVSLILRLSVFICRYFLSSTSSAGCPAAKELPTWEVMPQIHFHIYVGSEHAVHVAIFTYTFFVQDYCLPSGPWDGWEAISDLLFFFFSNLSGWKYSETFRKLHIDFCGKLKRELNKTGNILFYVYILEFRASCRYRQKSFSSVRNMSVYSKHHLMLTTELW